MKFRSAWVALSSLVLVGCATLRSPAPEPSVPAERTNEDPFEADEELKYEGSIVQELVECQLWNETCMLRVQDIRHQAANQAKLDALLGAAEQARQEQQQQHEETIRTMKRIAGLDPDAGAGFWCLSVARERTTLVECRRSWEACADRILGREKDGVKVENRRCEEYAQAACFRVTRNLQEGERAMCYGDVATCEMIRDRVQHEGLASPPTACRVTD